nr:reverse transcriptase domain-containing protein [Tanacetum cinerariifolium]
NGTNEHEHSNLSFSGIPRVPEFTGKDEMKKEKEALKEAPGVRTGFRSVLCFVQSTGVQDAQKRRSKISKAANTDRLWQLRLFLFLRRYQSRVWDSLSRDLSLSILFLLRSWLHWRLGRLQLPHLSRVLELDTHSSLEADPSKSSPPPVSIAPMVSPFLCLDDSELDTKIPERHVSPTTSTPEIHTAPILPAPSAIVAPSSEFPLAAVALTARKSVRPLPSHSLALRDSSSESSAGSSRKRCISPVAIVTSSIHYTRALVPSRADLLPLRKRFRDSISPEDSVEEDNDADMLEDIKADATTVRVGINKDVDAGLIDRGTMKVGVNMNDGIDIPDGMLMLGVVDRLEQSSSSHGILAEFRQVRKDCDDTQRRVRRLESFVERHLGFPIKELVNRCVEEALAAYEATRAANAIEAKNQSQNGSDCDNGNGNGRNKNGKNRNGEDGNVGNGNPNKNNRDARPVVRECTYQDFMKCQPLNFKGMEGVVGLTRWFEKMEAVFHINNCTEKYQVNYATCTMLNSALTWWNSHKRTTGTEATFTMSWRELMKLMAKVMVHEEEDRIEHLMDQKLKEYAVKNAKSKRRLEVNQRDNHGQQPAFKKVNVGGQSVERAYTAKNNKRRPYNRPLPLYNKCKLDYEGPYIVRCGKCNKNGVGEARGKPYVLGVGDANPDSNVVKGTFLLNNHYAFVLFNSGANRSFVSSTFSTLLDIILDALDVSYVVELADGRSFETNTVLKGCTLGLLGHPFNVELMPVELGSFYVIIGMDWLANHHAVIVCDEKIVRIPYGDEVLIVQGDEGGKGEKSKLSIILCTKTQKYIKKGLAGYYRRFIKGFSKIVKPMMKPTQKNEKYDWSEKAEAEFQLLKQKLYSAPIRL